MIVERDLPSLLTSEMTQDEWTQFRKEWIDQFAKDLVTECGETDDEMTRDVAGVHFENYCGQEGWTGRDERIRQEREKDYLP